MSKDNALISTAVLTAIWDESHKDNIELIKPFVLEIINKSYSINQELDETFIINQMREKYCFNRFPLAVLKIVLTRLKKDKILRAENKKFILNKDVSEDTEIFNNKRLVAKSEVNKTIDEVLAYLSEQMGKKVSRSDAEKYFSDFISSYGYNTYENINSIKGINRKTEFTNYLIGEFICNEEKNNSDTFKNVLKIIEGHMIANAIYLQIENDNKASLKKLTCYLDSPFILRVFGLKSDEENKSAKELYDLLNKYGANIKCFSHTYQEVYNIINFYKNNIGKSKENTLEYLDEQKYTEGQVDLLLSSLESKFKQHRIEIVDKPDFTTNKKYMIDYKGLEDKLIAHKEQNNSYFSENSISNDVDSVSSINILRKGNKTSKIENCNYIFVTTYHYLKVASKEIMTELSDTDIGLVIDDLDLTTILWFKDFENNSELPKLRLVENALAATNASDEIIKKAIPIFESIKKDNSSLDLDSVSNCLTKHYLKASGYIDMVKNDPDLVTKESMVDFLSKKDEELKKKEKELEDTKKRNLKIQNNIQDNFIKDAEVETENTYNQRKKKYHIVYYICVGILSILSIVCIILSLISDLNILVTVVLAIIDLIGFIDLIIPKSKFVLKKIDNYCLNKKRDELSEKTNKIMSNMNVKNNNIS